MSGSGDFDADAFRDRLWDKLLESSVDAHRNEIDADAVIEGVFADITAVLRKRFGWSIGETELFLADARSRADRALADFDGATPGADATLIDIDDAADIAVVLLTEKDEGS
jgi:hypothetical protein